MNDEQHTRIIITAIMVIVINMLWAVLIKPNKEKIKSFFRGIISKAKL